MKQAVIVVVPHPYLDDMWLAVSRKSDHSDLGCPGGKVENTDASLRAAMFREFKEEVGLEIFNMRFSHSEKRHDWLVLIFRADMLDFPSFVNSEDSLVCWATTEQMCNGTFGEFNRNNLTRFKQHTAWIDIELDNL